MYAKSNPKRKLDIYTPLTRYFLDYINHLEDIIDDGEKVNISDEEINYIMTERARDLTTYRECVQARAFTGTVSVKPTTPYMKASYSSDEEFRKLNNL